MKIIKFENPDSAQKKNHPAKENVLRIVETEKADETCLSPHEEKLQNLEFISRLLNLIDKTEKIDNMDASKTTYELNHNLTAEYSTEELFKWLESSSDTDFQEKPSFFKAVLAQLRDRIDTSSIF